MEIMKKGMKNRHIGSTYMNIESSRSHSIFTITVESQVFLNKKVLLLKIPLEKSQQCD